MRKFILLLGLISLPFLVFSQDYGGYSEPEYLNGDVTMDGVLCFDDPVSIIFALYSRSEPLPCVSVADVNRNGVVELGDALLLLNHIFRGTAIQDCWVTCGRVGIE